MQPRNRAKSPSWHLTAMTATNKQGRGIIPRILDIAMLIFGLFFLAAGIFLEISLHPVNNFQKLIELFLIINGLLVLFRNIRVNSLSYKH
jgi:hypothetical protein